MQAELGAKLLAFAVATAGVVVACGSDDDKKAVRAGEAGAAGMAASASGAPGNGEAGDGGTEAGGAPGNGVTGGAGASAGASAGGVAGAGEPLGNDLYVSPTGSDADAGTFAEPLLTIEHAAELAQPFDRIHLLDGIYDATTQPAFAQAMAVQIPDGVAVGAINEGLAVLDGESEQSASGLVFLGAGELVGVKLKDFATAISASTGALSLQGISLENCGNPTASPLELSGDVTASLQPGSSEDYVASAGGRYLATLTEQAKLEVSGGRVANLQSGAANGRGVFHVQDQAELLLDGVLLEALPAEAVYAEGSSSVTLRAGTVIEGTLSPALAAIELQGTAALVMDDAKISNSYWASISTIGMGSVEMRASTIESTGSWGIIVNAPGPVTLKLEDSVIRESGSSQLDVRAGATIDITGSQIVDGVGFGATLGSAESVHFTLRDSTISGNNGGIQTNAAAGSTLDLGTVDSPGGNDLSANGAQYPSLGCYLPAPIVAYAVGNTWNADEQGASAQGGYAVGAPGAKLDITGPVVNGLNYRVFSDGAVLRLAENP